MKITYFFRHPDVGVSIHRVFRTIIDEVQKKQDVRCFDVPRRGSMPWDVLMNNLYVFFKRDTKSINHVTGHIHDVLMALAGCKTILTIHDLVFIDHVKNPIKRFYKWLFWLYLPVKIANKVVCISNKTKHNILKYIKTDKLSVIYDPVDPIFNYVPKLFNEEKPIVLHIGTGWNKNLLRTIEALQGISCHLRIVGKLKPEQKLLLEKYQIDYSNVSNLSDEQIRQEYTNCDIVNFPSEYEGFGMPIVEGQKTGRVVITSNLEPLIEVAGGAVQFVDPFAVSSIKKAYINIIHDGKKREELISLGLKNAERFSAKSIADQYSKIYQELQI